MQLGLWGFSLGKRERVCCSMLAGFWKEEGSPSLLSCIYCKHPTKKKLTQKRLHYWCRFLNWQQHSTWLPISELIVAQFLLSIFELAVTQYLAADLWIDNDTVLGCRSLNRQRHSFCYRFLNQQRHCKAKVTGIFIFFNHPISRCFSPYYSSGLSLHSVH